MLMLALLMHRRQRLALALAVVACSLGAGCATKDAPAAGVLVVPYELGNHKDCATVGVKVVRAELDDPMYVEEAACESGEIRFQEVPPGGYHVRLFGVDSQGVAIMDSLQAGEVPVNVVGDGTTVVADPAVMLTAAPAHLLLRWSFGFGTCESAAIDRFRISAWRKDGSQLLLESTVPCKEAGSGADQYRAVPDLSRKLAGDEVGEVNVEALDKNGVATGEATTFNFGAPGSGHTVKLSVVCTGGACVGGGKPD